MNIDIRNDIKKFFYEKKMDYINFIFEYDYHTNKIEIQEVFINDEDDNKNIKINIIGNNSFTSRKAMFSNKQRKKFFSLKRKENKQKIHVAIFVTKSVSNNFYINIESELIKETEYLIFFIKKMIDDLFTNVILKD